MSHRDNKEAWLRYGWEPAKPDIPAHLPARTGAHWNSTEINDLRVSYYVNGNTIPELAQRHQRGANGIIAQLNRIPMKRSNPDIIAAYAEGKDVQYRTVNNWIDYGSNATHPPLGDAAYAWRVTPTPVVRKERLHVQANAPYAIVRNPPVPANLELTFTDNKLTGACVL